MRTVNGVVLFDEAYKTLRNTLLPQVTDLFNQKSNGAIVLNGTTPQGDYAIDKFIKNIADAADYDRDPASTGDVTGGTYAEQEYVAVKSGAGFLVHVPASLIQWASSGAEVTPAISKAIKALAEQYVDKRLNRQFNQCIAVAGAAIEANTAMTLDLSADGEIVDQLKLNKARFLYGDRAYEKVVAIVGSSGGYEQLVGDAIANSNLDTVGGVAINEGTIKTLGVPFIMTDAPALAYNDGTRDVYKFLLLTAGAVGVTNVSEVSTTDTPTGKENIVTNSQVTYDFSTMFKGASWDMVNGGPAPTSAEIATGTNWDKVAQFDKDFGGACLITPQVATP